MSGNIDDTDVHRIRKEVFSLIDEIQKIKNSGEQLEDWRSTLQNRHKYLYKTSNTLFNYILDNMSKDSFNPVFFNQTLNMMLSQISKIQTNSVSQNDASVIVGTHLAEEYVPQLKKKE